MSDTAGAMDACIFTYRLLNQKKYWWNNEGKRLRVKKMPVSYKRNVLNFLDRRAGHLAAMYAMGELVHLPNFAMMGEMAADAVEHAMFVEGEERSHNPQRWLRGTVLVSRLRKDILEAENLYEATFDPWERA